MAVNQLSSSKTGSLICKFRDCFVPRNDAGYYTCYQLVKPFTNSLTH
jgi:hypothetical protein